MVAALAATMDPSISSYQLVSFAGDIPTAAVNDYQGYILSKSALDVSAQLDSITETKAEAQVNSDLTTLNTALPPGTIVSDSVTTVPLGAVVNSFGLEVDVDVSSEPSIANTLGDFVDGLQTGLTGSVTGSLIEGLAINVSSGGTPIVGSWQAVRDGTGTVQFAEPGQAPTSMTTSVAFPNLTGGPSTKTSGIGSPVTFVPQHSPLEQPVASPGHVLFGTHRIGKVSPKPGSKEALTLTAVAVLGVIVVGVVLILRRRRRVIPENAH